MSENHDTQLEQINIRIGQKLRQIRLERNLSQTQTGEMIGLTYQQMQKFERGTNRISANQLFGILSALDIPLNVFEECFDLSKSRYSNQLSKSPYFIGDKPIDREHRDLLNAYAGIANKRVRKIAINIIKDLAVKDI